MQSATVVTTAAGRKQMRGDNGSFVQAAVPSSEPSDGVFPIILCNPHDTDWGVDLSWARFL